MIDGLKFIRQNTDGSIAEVRADDHADTPFDTEDDFNTNSVNHE